MACTNPQNKSRTVNGASFDYVHPCGQCMACRIRKREEWTTRLLLEATLHPIGWVTFSTLTYANQPVTECGYPTLKPEDVTRFLDRLRRYHFVTLPESVQKLPKERRPRLRYFIVGEYGEKSWRPHYHMMLYGAPLPLAEALVRKAWPEPVPILGLPENYDGPRWKGECGWSEVKLLTVQRARYVARYTTKRLTQPCSSLGGRVPEFARMSRNPGLASGMGAAIWQSIRHHGMDLVASDGEPVKPGETTVPGFVRFSGKLWPLDSYLRQELADSAKLITEKSLTQARHLDEGIYRSTPVGTDFMEAVQKLEAALRREETEDDHRPTPRAV